MPSYCLLTEPLLPAAGTDGLVFHTLPGLLAELCADRVEDIGDLAAHQQQPFYQFLVQLAVLALVHADPVPDPDAEPPDDAETWRVLLSALAPAEAWSLVVADAAAPAFLQPPAPEGSLDRYTPLADTADGIDTLVTGRAVDLKPARAVSAKPHHWVYALISLQTGMGFLGRGNYGIARMNGGFSSRPMMELAPLSMRWGARLRRSLRVLLSDRARIFDEGDFEGVYSPGGTALLWLEPWDGKTSRPLSGLEPHFIEVCRRVRLVGRDGRIVALGRPTDAARLDAKTRMGNLGDPWTPIDREAGKAVTFQTGAFEYRRLTKLLTNGDGIALPAAMAPLPGDDPRMVLHATVLVRGQGKTEGLERRVIPLSTRIAGLFQRHRKAPVERLNTLSARMVGDAGRAQAALGLGLALALEYRRHAQESKLSTDDKRIIPVREALDRQIDGFFFDHLWAQLEAEETSPDAETLRVAWHRALRRAATTLFHRELDRLPEDAARVGPARAAAMNLFHAMLNDHLPLPAQPGDESEKETDDDDHSTDAAA